MKIMAFEVRGDEIAAFDRVEVQLPVTITRLSENLREDNLHLCQGADAVTVLGRSMLTREMLGKLREMGVKAVSTRTVGTNHIDLTAARELGMPVCNTRYGAECVADYTVMLLLISLRNYKPALWRMQVNDYSLTGLQGRQISSLTVGVVGTGRIGLQVMQDLSGFGCKFLCYDPYPNPAAEKFGTYVPLEQIWADCDVITFHTPLTEENYHMVNRASLEQMKDGVILINTARGGLMDMDAVIEAVENQKIGRLAMDVFEDEEGIYHEDRRIDIIKNRKMAYIRQFPNVVTTQHMAFFTQEAVESMVQGGVRGVYELITEGRTAAQL